MELKRVFISNKEENKIKINKKNLVHKIKINNDMR